MAVDVPLSAAQAELVKYAIYNSRSKTGPGANKHLPPSSLSQEEVPIKLRCAICSKLAVNTYKLPCCEQAICEKCWNSQAECTHAFLL